MDSFKYLHICDHKQSIDSLPVLSNIIINDRGTFIPLLNETQGNLFVPKILQVFVLDDTFEQPNPDFEYDNQEYTFEDIQLNEGFYDPELPAFYYDYNDFKSDTHLISLPEDIYTLKYNHILWKFRPPKLYKVFFQTRDMQKHIVTHKRNECPICNGQGWYVDIMPHQQSTISITGIERIAQRVVKDIITSPGSNTLETTYGGGITDLIARYSNSSEEELKEQITFMLREVETNYLSRQESLLASDSLTDEETMVSMGLYRLQRVEKTKIILEIFITTPVNQETFRLPV